MKTLFLTIAIALSIYGINPIYGQVAQVAYTEIKVEKKSGDNYQTLITKDKGILCFLESQEHAKGGKKPLHLYYYDQNLELQWEKTYLIDFAETILYEDFQDGTAYFLTQKKEDEYRVLGVNTVDGSLLSVALSPIKNFLITDFLVYKKRVITGGRINNHPLVMLQAFKNETTPVVLPSISQVDAELIDILVDPKFDNLYVVLDKTKPISQQAIYINRYDADGNIISNSEIPFSNEYNMLSYRVIPTDKENNLMIYGTYGLGNDTGTQGVYNFRLENGSLIDNRFYDFSYLKNFFNYLPANAQKRRLRKIEKQQDNGKRMRHRYKCFIHPLQVTEDRVIFTLETYDATADFRRTSWNMGNGYGSWADPSLRRYMNTLGYYGFMPMSFVSNRWRDRSNFPTTFDYKHAVVLGFNKEGQLLWDNSFNFIDGTESSFPIEQAQVATWNDSSLIIQMDEDVENLMFKVSALSEYQEEPDTLEIPIPIPGDEIYDSEYGGILYWHDQSFISSGIRKIKNKQNRQNDRHIFFLAKYAYTGIKPEEDAAGQMNK